MRISAVIVLIRDEVERVLFDWLFSANRTFPRFQEVSATLGFFERDIDRIEDCEMKEALDEKGEWGYTLTHKGEDMHFRVVKIKEEQKRQCIELDGKAKQELEESIKKEVKNQAESMINTDNAWGNMQEAMQWAVRHTLGKAGYEEKEIEKYIEDNFTELSTFGVRAEVDFDLD